MADYYTRTVLRQDIPARLISPLERFLLGEIFESEEHKGDIYYYSSEGPPPWIMPDRRELEQALAATAARSRLRRFLVARLVEAGPDQAQVDIDLTAIPCRHDAYVIVLQDIVRRAAGELPCLSIAQAHTCSKMRQDGFGGAAIIITPQRVLYHSTDAFFLRFERWPAEPASSPAAPP